MGLALQAALDPRVIGFIAALILAGSAQAHAQADDDPPTTEQARTPESSVSSVEAESHTPVAKEKVWNFVIAPYVLFPFMNGSLTLANQQVDVNITAGDIIRALNWGLMLYFAARHPKFSIATDLLYMNLGQGGQLPVSDRSAELKMQQLLAEVVFLGRIVEWFELGFGGRVNFVQVGLTAPAGRLLPAVDLDDRHTWFDPLIVLRFSVPFKNDHWRLGLRADVGGFAAGSLYAWQVYPYGGYNFDGIKDRRVFELALAFRALGMKYETGSGLNRFVYDIITWGPEIGFLFHF